MRYRILRFVLFSMLILAGCVSCSLAGSALIEFAEHGATERQAISLGLFMIGALALIGWRAQERD